MTHRPDLLAALNARRHSRREKPIVRYTCGDGGTKGRGECTLLEVWASKLGPLMFLPAMESLHPGEPEREATVWVMHKVLKATEARTGGSFAFIDLLLCKHRSEHLEPAQLRSDVEKQVGVVRLTSR